MATNWTPVADAAGKANLNEIVGVSIIAPNGQVWSQYGDRQFPAASTVKIPLMIEIYRMFDEGRATPDDIHVLTAEDKTPGSGVLLHLHEGLELTINDLIYLTISISDNTATNILIDIADMRLVTATMQNLGMQQSVLGRKMAGRTAVDGEQENWATPDDYALVLKRILDGDAASASSCEAMLEMLKKQQNLRRTGRYVPQSKLVSWGSKTGSLAGIVNDVGFIKSPEGTLVVAVFCSGVSSDRRGEDLIAEITRAAMQVTGVADPL